METPASTYRDGFYYIQTNVVIPNGNIDGSACWGFRERITRNPWVFWFYALQFWKFERWKNVLYCRNPIHGGVLWYHPIPKS